MVSKCEDILGQDSLAYMSPYMIGRISPPIFPSRDKTIFDDLSYAGMHERVLHIEVNCREKISFRYQCCFSMPKPLLDAFDSKSGC
jgi:hypothetical protein